MLRVKKQENESWIECITRYAKPWGLEEEVLSAYYKHLGADKMPWHEAAWCALYDSDLLDFVDQDLPESQEPKMV